MMFSDVGLLPGDAGIGICVGDIWTSGNWKMGDKAGIVWRFAARLAKGWMERRARTLLNAFEDLEARLGVVGWTFFNFFLLPSRTLASFHLLYSVASESSEASGVGRSLLDGEVVIPAGSTGCEDCIGVVDMSEPSSDFCSSHSTLGLNDIAYRFTSVLTGGGGDLHES